MKALNERLYSPLSYLLPHLKFGVFLLLLTGFFLNSWAHNYSKHWAGLNFYDFIINSFFNVNGRLTMYVTTYFNNGCAFNRRQVSPRPLWFTMCPNWLVGLEPNTWIRGDFPNMGVSFLKFEHKIILFNKTEAAISSLSKCTNWQFSSGALLFLHFNIYCIGSLLIPIPSFILA